MNINKKNKDLKLENENINETKKQVDDFKNKQNLLQYEHHLYRKQLIDLQVKILELRFEYENLNNNNHNRKHITYYQLLKSSILDEIIRQCDMH